MKKMIFMLGAMAAMTFVSCSKEKTQIIKSSGDTTTIVTPGIDKEKIDSATMKADSALKKTGEAIKEGAQDVKEGAKNVTAKTAEAVEKGAKKVKEEAKK